MIYTSTLNHTLYHSKYTKFENSVGIDTHTRNIILSLLYEFEFEYVDSLPLFHDQYSIHMPFMHTCIVEKKRTTATITF